MIEKRPMHPPDSAPPVVGAGQPIPEYLLRSLPELRVLPDWAAFLAWQKACGKRTQRSYRWHILWLTAVGALAGTLGGLGGPLLARLLGCIGITGLAAVATAASLASLFAVCTTGMITVWLVRGRTRRRVREASLPSAIPSAFTAATTCAAVRSRAVRSAARRSIQPNESVSWLESLPRRTTFHTQAASLHDAEYEVQRVSRDVGHTCASRRGWGTCIPPAPIAARRIRKLAVVVDRDRSLQQATNHDNCA